MITTSIVFYSPIESKIAATTDVITIHKIIITIVGTFSTSIPNDE